MDQKLFEQAFQHARLKINRADRHIHEAQHWFRVYVESDFYELVDDRNSQTGQQRIGLRVTFPDGLEVFAGRPVFPTLLECSQLVSDALERIEAVARRYL